MYINIDYQALWMKVGLKPGGPGRPKLCICFLPGHYCYLCPLIVYLSIKSDPNEDIFTINGPCGPL